MSIFIVLLALAGSSAAQIRTIRQTSKESAPVDTKVGVGVGVARSVLYLSRNVKENNDAYGIHTSLVYMGADNFRVTVEYTRFNTINIQPTWYNVSAFTLESNFNILFRLPDAEGMFYPSVGFSYNSFKGYFTGRNDFLQLSQRHPPESWVLSRWFGVNTGIGYEHIFGSVLGVYADYKMRIGVSEGTRQITIMDVCFNAGIRYHIKTRHIGKLFRGTRSRYTLQRKSSK